MFITVILLTLLSQLWKARSCQCLNWGILETARGWWANLFLRWSLLVPCIPRGLLVNPFTSLWAWGWRRLCHRSPHALVGCHSTCKLRWHLSLANLHIFWQSVEVYPRTTNCWGKSSCCLHSWCMLFLIIFTNWDTYHFWQLPRNFQDEYRKHYTHASSDDVYTHCKCELMHAIWKLLLNVQFADTYKNGIVIKFFDGITRRVFPRFFTYSADYPKKWVLYPELLTRLVTQWV